MRTIAIIRHVPKATMLVLAVAARCFGLRVGAMLFALLVMGCTATGVQSDPSPAQPVNLPPIRTCVLIDLTGSILDNRLEPFTPEDFGRLLALFQERGGEIAVGAVTQDSDQAFIRASFKPPSAPPLQPASENNPYLMNQANAIYQEAFARWKVLDTRRLKCNKEISDAFLFRALPILQARPNCRRTDVWGAISRARLFFQEPQANSGPIHKYLLILSDGQDNVRNEPVAQIMGVTGLLVNGTGSVGSLAAWNLARFESPNASVNWLLSQEQKGESK